MNQAPSFSRGRSGRRASRPQKAADQLDLGRPGEGVDQAHGRERKAAVRQDAGIARKARGIAGHHGDARDLRGRQGLRLRPRARRAADRGSPRPVGRARARQRRALQVARLGRDPVAEPCRPRRVAERRQHLRLRVDRMHPAARGGKRQAKSAAAGEQVGDVRSIPDRVANRGANLGLGLRARLQEGAGRQLLPPRSRTITRTGRRATITSGSSAAVRCQDTRARSLASASAAMPSRSARPGSGGRQQHQIEAAVGGGDQHLAAAARRAADRPAPRARAAGGRQSRAARPRRPRRRPPHGRRGRESRA